MITLPNGKICMNEQEAIQWLLDNYPIPFQCSANYAADTEIGLGTIVNPTPAKVKVGSIIFFADSKVSTVVGLTANGFICSDQYNDLVDDVVYVSNVQLNASGHLIVTLSNNNTIDAGLIKQLSGLSINASQHLIATYNDGTSTDLGAIFSGNVNIAGNLTADSIIENMTGYSFTKNNSLNGEYIYVGMSKTGNKLTLVAFFKLNLPSSQSNESIGFFNIPNEVGAKIYPFTIGSITSAVAAQRITAFANVTSVVDVSAVLTQYAQNSLRLFMYGLGNLALNTDYLMRVEITLLLSDNLAA